MKFTLGLLVGATLGGVIVHYLNSVEGRALVNKVKEDAADVSDNISGMTDTIVAKGKSILGKDTADQDSVEEIVVIGLNG